MNKSLSSILFLFAAISISYPALAQTTNHKCTMPKSIKWLNAKEWANGLSLKVYDSVNAPEFEKQYNKNKVYWDKAFAYLKNTNLDTISPGKYYLDGENVIATVSENKPKEFEATKWEAHRKYIDIQYIISGKERMGVAPLSKATVIDPYNEIKDIGFYSIADADSRFYLAEQGVFLIFFPCEIHRPNIKTDGCDKDKKIVIKVKAD